MKRSQALLVLVVGFLMVHTVGRAHANTIVRIDDSGGGIPIVTSTDGALAIIASGPEFIHFTHRELNPAPVNFILYTDFLEADGTLSDRVILSGQQGIALLDVVFSSDPQTLTLPPGAIRESTLVEDGTFQFFNTYSNLPDGVNTEYYVRSDIDPVPEPAAFVLFTIGLTGMALYRRR